MKLRNGESKGFSFPVCLLMWSFRLFGFMIQSCKLGVKFQDSLIDFQR